MHLTLTLCIITTWTVLHMFCRISRAQTVWFVAQAAGPVTASTETDAPVSPLSPVAPIPGTPLTEDELNVFKQLLIHIIVNYRSFA